MRFEETNFALPGRIKGNLLHLFENYHVSRFQFLNCPTIFSENYKILPFKRVITCSKVSVLACKVWRQVHFGRVLVYDLWLHIISQNSLPVMKDYWSKCTCLWICNTYIQTLCYIISKFLFIFFFHIWHLDPCNFSKAPRTLFSGCHAWFISNIMFFPEFQTSPVDAKH